MTPTGRTNSMYFRGYVIVRVRSYRAYFLRVVRHDSDEIRMKTKLISILLSTSTSEPGQH